MLVAACAVAPTEGPLPALDAPPAAFELSGRIAIRDGGHSEIARLRWTHAPDSDLWVISSVLGNEVARIESGPHGARLLRAGGEAEEASSFARLSEKVLGVALDPGRLAEWLHGATPPGGLDWAVAVEARERAGSVDLARKLSARRGDVTVRLVVDQYRPLGAQP